MIGIIIPVYNSFESLDRCIKSILGQSFQDIRLLLVDDGSSDSSLELCNAYARYDQRVVVLHQTNQGVSSARNLGLSFVVGDWIMFVDADDYLEENAVMQLVEMSGSDVDLVIADCLCEQGSSKRIIHFPKGVLCRSSFSKLFSEYELPYRTSVWGKLYRQSIIRNNNLLFDPKMKHGEDLVFLYHYLEKCTRVAFTGSVSYHYMFDNAISLSRRCNDYETEKYGREMIISATDNIKRNLDVHEDAALRNLEWPVKNATERTLNSLYHCPVNTKDRLQGLAELNADSVIYRSHQVKERKTKFLYWLLENHFYKLYDFIRIVAARFRPFR